MKKKICKIIIAIVMLINILPVIVSNYSYASIEDIARSSQASLFGNITQSAKNFLNTGKNNQKITAATAKDKILPIAGILIGIATVVFLIVGGIIGVQYMMSGANERAQLKQKLIWFVVAVAIVYGAAGIFNIAVKIMLKVTGE